MRNFSLPNCALVLGLLLSVGGKSSTAAAQERPVVVYAQPPEMVRTIRVDYSDLILARPSHERKLKLRVAGAVKRVCLYEGRSGLQDRAYYICADKAWDDARRQIADAVLSASKLAKATNSSAAGTAIIVSATAH